MNVLWLSSPFRKDDILTNKDAVWVYTENELREGGGEMREFIRQHRLKNFNSLGVNLLVLLLFFEWRRRNCDILPDLPMTMSICTLFAQRLDI